MAFQFPDPSITPEFTGDNGITYIWDVDDKKWAVKAFGVEVHEDFDPALKGHVCAEFFTVVADYNAVEKAKGHSMATYDFGGGSIKYWTKPPEDDFFNDGESYYIDEHGPYEIKTVSKTDKWITFFIDGGHQPAVGSSCTFSKTRKLCTEVAALQAADEKLHQDIIELEEEIDAIAPSVERGHFRSTAHDNIPRDGEFMLRTLAGKTINYGDKDIVVVELSKVDDNGVPHSFADTKPGQLIQLFEENVEDFGLYQIDSIAGTDPSTTAVTFTVTFISGTGEATIGDLARLKIFSPPEGGTASEFVKKIGDTMTGDLTMGKDPLVPGTDSPKIVFKSQHDNGSTYTNSLFLLKDNTVLRCAGSFRAGGAVSANGNIQYEGSTRFGFGGNTDTHYFGFGTSSSYNVLRWNKDKGIKELKANNSWGRSGEVLTSGGENGTMYWSSGQYVLAGTAGMKITKDNGNYYIQ